MIIIDMRVSLDGIRKPLIYSIYCRIVYQVIWLNLKGSLVK